MTSQNSNPSPQPKNLFHPALWSFAGNEEVRLRSRKSKRAHPKTAPCTAQRSKRCIMRVRSDDTRCGEQVPFTVHCAATTSRRRRPVARMIFLIAFFIGVSDRYAALLKLLRICQVKEQATNWYCNRQQR